MTPTDTPASPLSEERVREYEQMLAADFEYSSSLYKTAMRKLLADRTALTARLEAVERERDELDAEADELCRAAKQQLADAKDNATQLANMILDFMQRAGVRHDPKLVGLVQQLDQLIASYSRS